MAKAGKFAAITAFLAAGLLLTAGTAMAGAVTVWPDQLKSMGTAAVFQDPDALESDQMFYAVVRIPVGRRVTAVQVTASSPSGGFDWQADLKRKKAAGEPVMVASFSAPNTDPIDPRATVATTAISPKLVSAGYRYWIQWEGNTSGRLHSIRIVYK